MSRSKQIKTTPTDKILRENTYLCVEVINSKRLVKAKFGHVVQIRVCRLT